MIGPFGVEVVSKMGMQANLRAIDALRGLSPTKIKTGKTFDKNGLTYTKFKGKEGKGSAISLTDNDDAALLATKDKKGNKWAGVIDTSATGSRKVTTDKGEKIKLHTTRFGTSSRNDRSVASSVVKLPNVGRVKSEKVSSLSGATNISARKKSKKIGSLTLKGDGEIDSINTKAKFRRRGIATAMTNEAQRRKIPIRHSDTLLPDGKKFAAARPIGNYVPEPLRPDYVNPIKAAIDRNRTRALGNGRSTGR